MVEAGQQAAHEVFGSDEEHSGGLEVACTVAAPEVELKLAVSSVVDVEVEVGVDFGLSQLTNLRKPRKCWSSGTLGEGQLVGSFRSASAFPLMAVQQEVEEVDGRVRLFVALASRFGAVNSAHGLRLQLSCHSLHLTVIYLG